MGREERWGEEGRRLKRDGERRDGEEEERRREMVRGERREGEGAEEKRREEERREEGGERGTRQSMEGAVVEGLLTRVSG